MGLQQVPFPLELTLAATRQGLSSLPAKQPGKEMPPGQQW